MSGRGADVRIVHLSDAVTVVVDIVAWGLIHAGAGYVAHRTSVAWLSRDRWLFRRRRRRGGRLYTRTLRIGRWKDRLPEAGALFAGGISKRHVTGPTRAGSSASSSRPAGPSWATGWRRRRGCCSCCGTRPPSCRS